MSQLHQRNNKNIQTLKTNRHQNLKKIKKNKKKLQTLAREDPVPRKRPSSIFSEWRRRRCCFLLVTQSFLSSSLNCSTNNTISRCGRGWWRHDGTTCACATSPAQSCSPIGLQWLGQAGHFLQHLVVGVLIVVVWLDQDDAGRPLGARRRSQILEAGGEKLMKKTVHQTKQTKTY